MSTSKVIELLAAMACMVSILTEIELNQLKHHGSTIATCSKLAMWNNPIFDNITNIHQRTTLHGGIKGPKHKQK